MILLFKSITVLTVYREGNEKKRKIYSYTRSKRYKTLFFYFVFEWAHWVVKFFCSWMTLPHITVKTKHNYSLQNPILSFIAVEWGVCGLFKPLKRYNQLRHVNENIKCQWNMVFFDWNITNCTTCRLKDMAISYIIGVESCKIENIYLHVQCVKWRDR